MDSAGLTYSEYLKSDRWRELRAQRLRMDGYKCSICGSAKNVQVHHVAYPEVYGSEGMDDLMSVCGPCHSRLHKGEEIASEIRCAESRAVYGMRQGAFTGWALKMLETGRYTLATDSLDALREEFMAISGYEETPSIAGLRYEAALRRNHKIDLAIEAGLTPKEIEQKYGIKRNVTYKRAARIERIAKMKIMNWDKVEASNGGGRRSLPAGAYVITITHVADDLEREYVTLTFDIAEGEHRGHYGDDWGKENTWAHSFKVSYKDKAESLFKHFLVCLEASNQSFNIVQWQDTGNVNAFVGKTVGVAWGIERYTKSDGSDGEGKTFPVWYPAQDVRDGKAKPPADKDIRGKGTATSAQQGAAAYDDLPF